MSQDESSWRSTSVPWIKRALLWAFVVSLLFVFLGGLWALRDNSYPTVEMTPPRAPQLSQKPVLKEGASAEKIAEYHALIKEAQRLDEQAVKTYQLHVTAFDEDLSAQLRLAEAQTDDRKARVAAYEAIVKGTIGDLLLGPMLLALLTYSGLQVSANMLIARRATQTGSKVEPVAVKVDLP